MNFVFWLLVALVAILLWFIISSIFIPLGTIALKKWNKTIEILNKEVDLVEKEKKENE